MRSTCSLGGDTGENEQDTGEDGGMLESWWSTCSLGEDTGENERDTGDNEQETGDNKG